MWLLCFKITAQTLFGANSFFFPPSVPVWCARQPTCTVPPPGYFPAPLPDCKWQQSRWTGGARAAVTRQQKGGREARQNSRGARIKMHLPSLKMGTRIGSFRLRFRHCRRAEKKSISAKAWRAGRCRYRSADIVCTLDTSASSNDSNIGILLTPLPLAERRYFTLVEHNTRGETAKLK